MALLDLLIRHPMQINFNDCLTDNSLIIFLIYIILFSIEARVLFFYLLPTLMRKTSKNKCYELKQLSL